MIVDQGGTNVRRLGSLISLRNQVQDEINKFSVFADQEISQAASRAIQRGILDSRNVVAAYFTSPQSQQALNAAFDILPAERVETMLGFLADDSPLHTALVDRLGNTMAQRMENSLVDAISLGMNPRKTASLVRRELGVGLTWALNTARTAQLYAYREATRASYMANSDVVSGWTWFASLDGRVCLSCVNQHGSKHGLDETLNDHHSGRCTMLPTVPMAKRLGIDLPEIEPGEAWFNAQPESFQIEKMGPSMYDAWRSGAFQFNQLSVPYQDPIYGEMLREASLVGLLGDNAMQFYRNR